MLRRGSERWVDSRSAAGSRGVGGGCMDMVAMAESSVKSPATCGGERDMVSMVVSTAVLWLKFAAIFNIWIEWQ